MTNQEPLNEQIAKALATGIIGGWSEAEWDMTDGAKPIQSNPRNRYINAAADVLAVLPQIAELELLRSTIGKVRDQANQARHISPFYSEGAREQAEATLLLLDEATVIPQKDPEQ